jgi:hypothetical protein
MAAFMNTVFATSGCRGSFDPENIHQRCWERAGGVRTEQNNEGRVRAKVPRYPHQKSSEERNEH